ncbi:MAG: hypothetical protein UU81_C0051G0011 [Microgenomates group bacterium GW2011_GWC1_41_8]|uniref:Uncharacterized protein n=2 Tax=Candidatus Roizmaniibacteriota TaxID=1752723 RepID=A0A0G0T5F7_9BACT|nr:MAG: hypothetical protein UU14_C0009G0014 [Candidatus Roizmanbacteria bacterium GW2011_GWB1_40_7]KKR95082.1 MAG: hypothetical protein UU41_C0001G0072 [Candidatus Roizmanbacteria bacterium GW2011_GWA1_41_13]KKS22598.1 MAG: hypothetical protein UU81_C0051G0011 [Microgenomates group bacterium GW2011_GWC1_41_8]
MKEQMSIVCCTYLYSNTITPDFEWELIDSIVSFKIDSFKDLPWLFLAKEKARENDVKYRYD